MRTPAFLLALLAVASLFLLSARPAPEAEAWEYKIVPVRTFAEGAEEPRAPIPAAEEEANKLAAQGWELMGTEVIEWTDAAINGRDFTVILTLRRQK